MSRSQTVLGLAALSGVFLALRLPHLSGLPNASHDEGNWLLVAWQIASGRPPELSPDARFVTALFAHMVSLPWRFAPMSLGSARGALVFWQLGFALSLAWLCVHIRLARAGLVIFALFAVHPWSVLWSRSLTVPYALSLVLSVLAPVAFLHAWMASPAHPRVARFITAQLFALGFHFTPLAALSPAATLAWALSTPDRRARLKAPFTLASGLLALLHVVPIGLSALGVAARGSTRPSHYFTWFTLRIKIYSRTIFDGLTGEATLRDFCGTELPWDLSVLASLCALGLMAMALRPPSSPRPEPSTVAPRDLASIGLYHFATAFVGLALMLAPMRQWHLQVIDSERYLFVTLAPFAMMLGALAEQRNLSAIFAPFFALYLLLGPTRRAAESMLYGGGPDRGLLTQYNGGAERRWKTARELRPLPELIFEEARRASRRGPVTIVTGDYRHHPLWFYRALHPEIRVDIASVWESTPSARPGMNYVFVRWSDGLFAPGFRPTEDMDANERVTAMMHGEDFVGLARVRTVVQPNGYPLMELWTARGAE